MTKEEALSKWKQAAGVTPEGALIGNWEPLERAIRHCSGQGDEIRETSPGVILVTVNKENARSPFHLVVA